MPDFENLLFEKSGASQQIAILTLNRPERANAMTPEMARELGIAIRRAEADDTIKAVVLTGAGKHFCAGLDGQRARALAEKIEQGNHPEEPFEGNLRHLHAVTLAIHESSKPYIAAINGSAAAGGLDIVLACDYRLGSDNAKFAESYVKLALPPLNGGAWLLKQAVGRPWAFRMLLGGGIVNAQEGQRIGIVQEIVPSSELLERAVSLAAEVSVAPAALIALLKSELRKESGLRDALARAYVAGVEAIRSEDYRQAVMNIPGAGKRQKDITE